jgi:hypothetical protein
LILKGESRYTRYNQHMVTYATSSGPFSPEQIAAAIAAAPEGVSDLPDVFWAEGFVSHSLDELKAQLAVSRSTSDHPSKRPTLWPVP